MAQTRGYTCDRCGKFEKESPDTVNHRPINWIRLNVETGHNGGDGMDLCGNSCLLALAKDRVKGERELAGVATRARRSVDSSNGTGNAQRDSFVAGDGARLANHHRWHTNKGVVKEDCEFCDRETAGVS